MDGLIIAILVSTMSNKLNYDSVSTNIMKEAVIEYSIENEDTDIDANYKNDELMIFRKEVRNDSKIAVDIGVSKTSENAKSREEKKEINESLKVLTVKDIDSNQSSSLENTSNTVVESINENSITNQTNNLILDMDFSGDVDDACALRIASNLHNLGVINLQAVTLCVNGQGDINLKAANGLLSTRGVNVPIGRSSVYIDDTSSYWQVLSEYSYNNFEIQDSVKLWRRIISENEKTNILTTGYLTNLKAFYESSPDEYSPLSGRELLETKVGNIYIVGGSNPTGVDNNFAYQKDAIEAASFVASNITRPLIFITNDVGGPLNCGARILKQDPNDALSRALSAFGTTYGRVAWDPVGVYIAAYGVPDGFAMTKINMSISNGTNTLSDSEKGLHYRVYRTSNDYNWYNDLLENLCF